MTQYANLTNEELLRLQLVKQGQTELEMELFSRLTAAIDEIEALENPLMKIADGANT